MMVMVMMMLGKLWEDTGRIGNRERRNDREGVVYAGREGDVE